MKDIEQGSKTAAAGRTGLLSELNYIFSRTEKWKLLGLLFLIGLGSVLEMLGVTVFMPFIKVVMNPATIRESAPLNMLYTGLGISNARDFLTFLAVGIILIYIFKNVFLAWEKNAIYTFCYDLQKRISVRLLRAYLSEPYTFHLEKNQAELIRSLQNDTDLFAKGVIHVIELVAEIVVCMALGIYLFTVSHSITVIVLAILLFVVAIFLSISRKLSRQMGQEVQTCGGKLYQYISEALGGIKEVKILGREGYFLNSYEGVCGKYMRAMRIGRLLANSPRYVVEATCMTGLFIAIIFKMYFGQKEVQDFIPQLAVFAVAAFRLLPSVGRINEHLSDILYSAPSFDLIYHDLRDVEDVPAMKGEAGGAFELKNAVKVDRVQYTYPGVQEPVLGEATLVIPRGKTVALIGSSGAGKTTLADILLGLLTPERGRIEADDMDIFKNLTTWQRQIGYIPQNIFLSDDTIKRNIAFGIPDAEIDDERVAAAAKKAQLGDFIDTLPDGYDTVVGERGARISGGQRQRIGIARALYNDPEVMVLDEATSALDGETEAAVMEAIDSLHGAKTMIIIAHRLTTIRNADIIYEVENGRIVERSKDEVFGGKSRDPKGGEQES